MPFPARVIEHNGERRTLAEWSEVTGIPVPVIRERIDRLAWSVADALRVPVDRRFSTRGRRSAAVPHPCPELKRHATGQAFARWKRHGRTWPRQCTRTTRVREWRRESRGRSARNQLQPHPARPEPVRSSFGQVSREEPRHRDAKSVGESLYRRVGHVAPLTLADFVHRMQVHPGRFGDRGAGHAHFGDLLAELTVRKRLHVGAFR